MERTQNSQPSKELPTLEEVLKKRNYRISRATRVRGLLMKQKKFLGTIKKIIPLKEPVLMLHRRTGRVEYHEDATAGAFPFTHSNGERRFIVLRPSDLEVHDYFGNTFKCYDCHEDRPFAGWENPVVDGESFMRGMEMSKQARMKYEESLMVQKRKMIWAWFLGIVVLVLGIALAITLIPSSWWDKIFNKETVNTAQNAPPVLGMLVLSARNIYRRIL